MKILVTAEQFGYGPIATCLNVVKHLAKYDDVNLSFMGCGIALEQARMSNYFENIIECRTYDEQELKRCKEEFLNSDVILSSENIPGARFALKLGCKEVYYIDNLMWMWDKLEDGLDNLKAYIISETFPCHENFERIGKNIKRPVFVGPLRDINIGENKSKKENKLIINIGGAEAFIIDKSIVISFYNKIINEILKTNIVDRFERIIICGGSSVISTLNIKSPKIEVCTLSNSDYLKELDSASHLIMAPGLGNFIETLWRDKDIMYLPPINYSQLLQLDEYEKMEFGFEILNWKDFSFFKEVPSLLNETDGVNLVLENVRKYLESDYTTLISSTINKFLNDSQDEFYDKRKIFAKNLKMNASLEVANLIYKENGGKR